ncbi:helicase-associated domain-containing protein, partial [Chloroflexota bacterium]
MLDQDLGQLYIIAELWGFEFSALDLKAGIEIILPKLLDPDLISEVIVDLPVPARNAIDLLIRHSGRFPWPLFSRRYGSLREMGPGRRDREKPYLDLNASPVELLWYRGVIGRAFFDTSEGPLEFVYIPGDLLTLLPVPDDLPRKPLGRLAVSAERVYSLPVNDWIVDDACTLLAALRMGMPVKDILKFFRLGHKAYPTPYPLTSNVLQRLLAAAGLINERGFPDPEPVRIFLESTRSEALALLADAWLNSSDFNELFLIPDLLCEGQWVNNPLQTRHTIIDFITVGTQVEEISPGVEPVKAWTQNLLSLKRDYWSLDGFISDLHVEYPDFQRPVGDYDSWYIRDRSSGEYIRGFEHWDVVDGKLVRYMVIGPLHWLGLVHLAAAEVPQKDKVLEITAFRVSDWAADLLTHKVPQPLQIEENPIVVDTQARLVLQSNVPRAVRYQVARFCSWEYQLDGTYHYRLTPASLEAARQGGLLVHHLMALLDRYAKVVPPNIIKALTQWGKNGSQARMERHMVLRLSSPDMLSEVRKSRASRFLGDPLGPT